MFNRIGQFVVRHPWRVIAAWVAAAVLVVALSPTVDDIVNEDDKAFVPDSYESARASAAERKAFPDSKYGSSLIVFKRSDGGKLRRRDSERIAAAVEGSTVHASTTSWASRPASGSSRQRATGSSQQ